MKKAHIVILSAILCILVFNILKANSFNLALQYAQLSPKDVNILESGIDSNGREFKAIKTKSATQNIVLAFIVKNRMGFWSCAYTNGLSGSGIASIGWMRNAGIRRFSMGDDPIFEIEWNNLYYGNNAIKSISFLQGDMPEQVAVNITQAGNEFSVHLLTYGEPNLLNTFNIQEKLLDSESISIQEGQP